MAEEVRVYVETPGGDPVEGVYLGLHDSASLAGLQSGFSPSSGVVTFPAVDEALNGGVYELRVKPPHQGIVTGGNALTLTVASGQSNDFTVVVTPQDLPVAEDQHLCRCSGYFVDGSGDPVTALHLVFSEGVSPDLLLSSGPLGSRGVIKSSMHNTKTDANGYASVDLIRGACYTVECSGWVAKPRTIEIPDAAAANLADVMYPFVNAVRWYDGGTQLVPGTAPTLAFSVGDNYALTSDVVLRSGAPAHHNQVIPVSSDPAVVGVVYDTNSGDVVLRGLSAGVAQVSFSRTTSTTPYAGITARGAGDVIGTLTITVS